MVVRDEKRKKRDREKDTHGQMLSETTEMGILFTVAMSLSLSLPQVGAQITKMRLSRQAHHTSKGSQHHEKVSPSREN